MNPYMIFLESDIIRFIFENFGVNPNFISLELPSLREENPLYFEFFDYFTQGEQDYALAFDAAALTYLAFKRQFQSLHKSGKMKAACLPEITNFILDSMEQDAINDDSWGRTVLQEMRDQNPIFLEFMTEFCRNSDDPVFVEKCFLFAYGILSLQLEEAKQTRYAIPRTHLQ